MDLLLEVLDTYAFDYVYAKMFPASLAEKVPAQWQKMLDLHSQNSTMNVVEGVVKPLRDIYGYAPYLLDFSEYTFQSVLPRHNMIRQVLTMFVVMTIFGWGLYMSVASFSYFFIFDKAIFNHPRYLKNQMSLEMKQALGAIPYMVLLTVPWFVLELNGHSKLYMDVELTFAGISSLLVEMVCFIMFTDCLIYLLHRWLHWPKEYKACLLYTSRCV